MSLDQVNENLGIFVKYNDKTELEGMETMKEHLKVYVDKGKVAWGHFTKTGAKRNKIGLWNLRTSVIDKQLSSNQPTFVFFYSRVSEELYVGNLIDYHNRDYPDTHEEIFDYIPKYYHDKVGSIDLNKDIGTMRSYAFLEVTNLRKLDFGDTEYIYNFKGDKEPIGEEKVLESKGMASLLYINLKQNFYERLSENISNIITPPFTNKIDFKVDRLVNETASPRSKDLPTNKNSTKPSTATNKGKSNVRKHSIQDDIKNKSLGLAGEQLVLELEREKVNQKLGYEYSQKIEHISVTRGDSEGYDILSWEELDDGTIAEKYIEVKATEGDQYTQFFISSGEVSFSKNNHDQYYLYRVYGYDKKSGTADYFVKKGSMEDNYTLIPKSYSVSLERK